MREKIVLIGAGSALFTRGLVADIIRHGWDCELVLVDVDPAALEVAEKLVRKMVIWAEAPVTVTASTERRDVLKDATAVICTIAVGGRRAWELDVAVPRKYDIFHPVGDSVMPGGTSRSLRMIPPMVDIARDVMDLAPDALFFNYGNPMGPVCRAVRKATGAKLVGLCHGVFQTARRIADELGCAEDHLTYTAVGMNHLTWFTEVLMDGADAMPRLKEIAQEKMNPGIFTDADIPFTWQMVDLFGAFPAVLDRHICEFFPHIFKGPGSYFGKTLGVDAFDHDFSIGNGDRLFAEMSLAALSPDPLPADYFDHIEGEHEQVIDIIASVRNNTGRVFSANLPNVGQVPNLPRDAVIECPAVADENGLHPISLPSMSSALAGTLADRFQWVETTVEAALEGSKEKFIQALFIDGAVDSVDMARRLADDLIEAQSEFLPKFK